jgi:hypothetical protein
MKFIYSSFLTILLFSSCGTAIDISKSSIPDKTYEKPLFVYITDQRLNRYTNSVSSTIRKKVTKSNLAYQAHLIPFEDKKDSTNQSTLWNSILSKVKKSDNDVVIVLIPKLAHSYTDYSMAYVRTYQYITKVNYDLIVFDPKTEEELILGKTSPKLSRLRLENGADDGVLIYKTLRKYGILDKKDKKGS